MKIINKPFLKFSEEEQKILYRCTHTYGFMQEIIDQNAEGIDAFVVYDNKGIAGWGSVIGWEKAHSLFMLYVFGNCRHKGIGRYITKNAVNKYDNLKMLIDFSNEEFINKMKEEFNIAVEENKIRNKDFIRKIK